MSRVKRSKRLAKRHDEGLTIIKKEEGNPMPGLTAIPIPFIVPRWHPPTPRFVYAKMQTVPVAFRWAIAIVFQIKNMFALAR